MSLALTKTPKRSFEAQFISDHLSSKLLESYIVQYFKQTKKRMRMALIATLTDHRPTVLPAKNDNDVMFCLQRYKGLRIDSSTGYD